MKRKPALVSGCLFNEGPKVCRWRKTDSNPWFRFRYSPSRGRLFSSPSPFRFPFGKRNHSFHDRDQGSKHAPSTRVGRAAKSSVRCWVSVRRVGPIERCCAAASAGAFSPVRLSSKSEVEFNKDRQRPIRVLLDLVHSRKRGSRQPHCCSPRLPAFAG